MFFKKLWTKRHSVVIKWFLSYICILIIPVSVSMGVYIQTSRVLENEITKANGFMLKQIKQDIESRLEDVERLNAEISWNPGIQDLMAKLDNDDNENQYDILKAIESLKIYKNSYNFIDSFYIYHLKSGFVLFPPAHRDSITLYNDIHNSENMSYEEWVRLIKMKHDGDFLLIDKRGDDGKIYKYLAYMNTIPPESVTDSTATLVIMIDINKLLLSFENIQRITDGELTIVNKNNNILIQKSFLNYIIPVDYNKLAGSEGINIREANGKKYVVTYVKSDKYGWKYTFAVPFSIFWEKSEYVRNLVVVSIIFSLLGGILLTSYFSRKNYYPINGLVRFLADKLRIDYKSGFDEMNFIWDAVSNTVKEQEKSSYLLKQQNKVLKSNYLTRLLKGNPGNDTLIAEHNSTFGISFLSDYFAVILFYHDNEYDFFSDQGDMDDAERIMLSRFVVSNVIEEIASQKNMGYAVEIDDMIACLISFNPESIKNARKEMERISGEAINFLKEKFNMNLSASISSVQKTVAGILQAYNEAVETLEYMIVLGKKEMLSYDDIPKELCGMSGNFYYYPLMLEQQLINSIKVGDIEKSKEILNNIFRENFDKSNISLQIANCLMFDLVATMIKTIDEINDTAERQFIEKLNPIVKLMGCHTVKKMQESILEILEEVSEFTRTQVKSNTYQKRDMIKRDLADNVARYIEDNYSDSNLNISIISKEYNMAPTYLSKIFKDCIGEGILDYISKYRILKAKELLRDYRNNIYDVATNVGFVDSNTFIRAFKKYEGITPGKFKDVELKQCD